MPRPKLCRRVCCRPGLTYFKPAGIRLVDLEETVLAVEEFEALRLKDLEGLEQETAAGRMNVSQPTFHRILSSARKKIAGAIVQGRAIRIEGGVYQLAGTRRFQCDACDHGWDVPHGTGRPKECPNCENPDIRRTDRGRGFARAGRGFCRGNGRTKKEKP